MPHSEKNFINHEKSDDLVKFTVVEEETTLIIQAEKNLYDNALASLLKYHSDLKKYMAGDSHFARTLSPHRVRYDAPPIIKEIAHATRKARIGPRAAFAGAIAEFVGRDLLAFTNEIVLENGGVAFLKINRAGKRKIYAGNSVLSEKIALEVDPRPKAFSVCNLAGDNGHFSGFGKADAVIVIAENALLAQAGATAISNVVKNVSTIEGGLKLARQIKSLDGVVIIKDDQVGLQGKVKIVPIK